MVHSSCLRSTIPMSSRIRPTDWSYLSIAFEGITGHQKCILQNQICLWKELYPPDSPLKIRSFLPLKYDEPLDEIQYGVCESPRVLLEVEPFSVFRRWIWLSFSKILSNLGFSLSSDIISFCSSWAVLWCINSCSYWMVLRLSRTKLSNVRLAILSDLGFLSDKGVVRECSSIPEMDVEFMN